MSAVLGWLNLLYYSNGFRNIGPLVLIFRKVLFVDLREWLLLYAMFTAGFAAAFNLQMKDAHLNNSSILDWESYHGAVIWTVRFVFGGGNYDDFRESQFPVFTAGLFFLYGFLVLVLLVNIFIAKLSTTYEIISEDSTRLWKLQFASLMLDIDSRLSPEMQAKIASQFGWRDSAFAGKTPDPLDRRFVFTERLQPASDGKTSEPTTLQIKIGKRGYPDGREVAILMVPDAHSWGGFFVDILYRWPLEAIVNPNVLYESWLSAEEANEHVGKKKGRVVEEPKWESSESARRKQQAVESAKAVERQKVFA
ncbi:Transient receptor putative cation channel sub V member 3, partial [Rhizoclosmatium hyalinum]